MLLIPLFIFRVLLSTFVFGYGIGFILNLLLSMVWSAFSFLISRETMPRSLLLIPCCSMFSMHVSYRWSTAPPPSTSRQYMYRTLMKQLTFTFNCSSSSGHLAFHAIACHVALIFDVPFCLYAFAQSACLHRVREIYHISKFSFAFVFVGLRSVIFWFGPHIEYLVTLSPALILILSKEVA